MSKHTKRSVRRNELAHVATRRPAKRSEELMNHPDFKYTFVNPIR
jgi:hypothetical protein